MLYRIGYWFKVQQLNRLAGLVQRIMYFSCYCDISVNAEIGPGLLVAHTFGLVIGDGTHMGRNCDVRQNITFGGNFNKMDSQGRSYPWVNDNVSFGVGAVIIGPITIGTGAVIGANSVVTKDVPDYTIVAGAPARIIKQRWDEGSGRRL
jgi:serine O-acetyltransferase